MYNVEPYVENYVCRKIGLKPYPGMIMRSFATMTDHLMTAAGLLSVCRMNLIILF